MIIFPLRCIYVDYVNWTEVSFTPGINKPQQKYQLLIMLIYITQLDVKLCNCWCQSAYKGNALETKSSYKQWASRFHYYMFNNNPQFIKQGPTIWISSRGISKSKKSIVYKRLQQTSLTTKKHKNCSRHQEYFITSNEFQNILLIGT